MTIQEFRDKHINAKVGSDIAERWGSRVAAQGLDSAGARGAESYLSQYGKGIKVQKVVAFARCAEIKGATAFATRMWEEAYFLETGARASLGDATGFVSSSPSLNTPSVRGEFGYRPQTLSVIAIEDAIPRLLSGDWVMQEKHDGERTVAEHRDGVVQSGNKHGLTAVRTLPLPIIAALRGGPNVVVDGEFLRKEVALVVFDILVLNGVDLRQLPYRDRLAQLERVASSFGQSVRLVRTFRFTSRSEILAKIDELKNAQAEGFVIKRVSAAVTEGSAHDDQAKVQFRATNSFVVGKRNGEKSSVEIFTLTSGEKVSAGFVTVPQSELHLAEEGAIAEVQYLYAFPETKKLAQATWKGVRDDATPDDCDTSKLRFRAA